MRVAPSIELPQQPRAPRRRGPDVFHRDPRRAALELELEERFRSAAVDDLDPAVARGGGELDDFDDRIGLAAVALEVQPVAVALTLALRSRDYGDTVRQPLGHAGGVGKQLEDRLDRDADVAGEGEGGGTHGR